MNDTFQNILRVGLQNINYLSRLWQTVSQYQQNFNGFLNQNQTNILATIYFVVFYATHYFPAVSDLGKFVIVSYPFLVGLAKDVKIGVNKQLL